MSCSSRSIPVCRFCKADIDLSHKATVAKKGLSAILSANQVRTVDPQIEIGDKVHVECRKKLLQTLCLGQLKNTKQIHRQAHW